MAGADSWWARDLESFVENLLKLLYNPTLSRMMGEYGRESVKAKFTKERLFRDVGELYLREYAKT